MQNGWRRDVVLGSALALVALGAAVAAAQPQPGAITPAAIAAAARHPGPLAVEPESTSELSKGFGTPRWAVGVTSNDGSFGHIAILLVDHGSFLTPDMAGRLAAAAAAPADTAAAIRADLAGQRDRATLADDRVRLGVQLAELDSIIARGALTRRLVLPRGAGAAGAAGAAVGYVTVLGFAAHGATFVAVLPSPDQRWELLVVTGGSLEGEQRKPHEKSAAYEQAMREQPLAVTEAIARAVYAQLFPPKKEG